MSSTAFSMPRFISIGLAPETTARRPSLKMASARTVAVVVPSPATSLVLLATSRDHAGAHVLVLVFQLDLLGDGDAVLGDGRRAEALLEDDVAALGPERHLDGAGQLGDAPPHRLAGFLIERNLLRSHRASRWVYVVQSRIQSKCRWAVDHSSITASTSSSRMRRMLSPCGLLELVAGPVGEQHGVALLDLERRRLAVLESACRGRRAGPCPSAACSWRSPAAGCRRPSSPRPRNAGSRSGRPAA